MMIYSKLLQFYIEEDFSEIVWQLVAEAFPQIDEPLFIFILDLFMCDHVTDLLTINLSRC